MLETNCRSFVQSKIVDTLAQFLVKKSIHANVITLMAVIVGVLVLPALFYGYKIIALALMWLSGYMDMLDGSVARAAHLKSVYFKDEPSPIGAVLDILGDRVVEASIVFGLFYVNPLDRGGVCLLMMACILICVTSFLVVGIFSANHSEKSFHYSSGLIERAEAFIFFSMMIVFEAYFILLGIIFSVLVVITTVVRVFQFRRSFLLTV